MPSDSEDEFLPLMHNTPSPYKRRYPAGFSKDLLFNNDELGKKLEAINNIEKEFNKKIVANIDRWIAERKNFNTKKIVDRIISSPASEGSSKKVNESLIDVIDSVNILCPYRTYFSPNFYFNKFNKDFLEPSQYMDKNSFFGSISTIEIVELIKSDALEVPNDSREAKNLMRFMIYLGSVTDEEIIGKRIIQLLSQTLVSFSDFIAIIDNWGRINECSVKTSKKVKTASIGLKSHGKPRSYNFEIVMDRVTLSLKQYSIKELKDLFVIFINLSMDPLLAGHRHILTQPLKLCIERLFQENIKAEKIIDLIDYENWHTLNIINLVFLLLNTGESTEHIGVLIGFGALSKLSSNLTSATPKFSVNRTPPKIDKDRLNEEETGEHSHHRSLLIELLASRNKNY